jgi:hypothetical protein
MRILAYLPAVILLACSIEQTQLISYASQINHSHTVVDQNKPVWFNKKSYKYHEPDCDSVKECTANCIQVSLKEALSRGGVACKACSGEWIEMP